MLGSASSSSSSFVFYKHGANRFARVLAFQAHNRPAPGSFLYSSDIAATMSSSAAEKYLIIGSGVFGAATPLELRRRLLASQVTLLDSSPFPSPRSASADLNKIIRADYPDPFYMAMALKAQEMWRHDPIYKPYYHQTGMLYVENHGMAQKISRQLQVAQFHACIRDSQYVRGETTLGWSLSRRLLGGRQPEAARSRRHKYSTVAQ